MSVGLSSMGARRRGGVEAWRHEGMEAWGHGGVGKKMVEDEMKNINFVS
ncbi:MAG: hypothetical protein K0B37_18125 [Bacteroidales bacterium]|nr:hypothetical protein [Bacteroidales bacterium]